MVGGILDLKHPMIPEAEQGRYTIGAATDKGEKIQQGFELREYGGFGMWLRPQAGPQVAPPTGDAHPSLSCSSVAQVRSEGAAARRDHHPGPGGHLQRLWEVSAPHPPTLFELGFDLRLTRSSPRYTYGKPVVGSVKAVFCRNAVSFFWSSAERPRDICRTYQLTVCPPPARTSRLRRRSLTFLPTFQTDRSGCASQTVTVGEFAPDKRAYVDRFDVSAELEEFGTGG